MPRKMIFAILAICLLVSFALGFLHLISNSNYIASVSLHARAVSAKLTAMDPQLKTFILSQTQDRIRLYNALIKKSQLEDGMVVNREFSGEAKAICDSLLFSSLRF